MAAEPEGRTILFLGDSLTAGYGVDPPQAFPSLIEEKIQSLGWKFRVVNAGQSGDVTAGGLRRLDWLLRRKVHVIVIELGINDALRGLPLELIRQNLQAIMDRARSRNPDVAVVLVGMQAPPNMGEEYATGFRGIYPELAAKNRVRLIPFFLEGVAGNPALNLPDGIHPTAEGYRIVAENVWKILEPILKAMG